MHSARRGVMGRLLFSFLYSDIEVRCTCLMILNLLRILRICRSIPRVLIVVRLIEMRLWSDTLLLGCGIRVLLLLLLSVAIRETLQISIHSVIQLKLLLNYVFRFEGRFEGLGC